MTLCALGLTVPPTLLALADEDKPRALAAYAKERGFALGDDVISYLLRHGKRDMRSLLESGHLQAAGVVPSHRRCGDFHCSAYT